MIYDRMKELGKLDELKKPIKAKDWSKNQRPGKYKTRKEEAPVEAGKQ
jgi:hypothetical protein